MAWGYFIGAGVALLAALAAAAGLTSQGDPRGGVETTSSGASPLQRNLERLRGALALRPGRKIAIVGQPGSGKTTLARHLGDGTARGTVGIKTDATDWSRGIVDELFQMFRDVVVVDSPGYNTRRHPVDDLLEGFPWEVFTTICVVFSGKRREADDRVLRRIDGLSNDGRVLLVRSFSERLTPEEQQEVVADWTVDCSGPRPRVFFVSNRSASGLTELRNVLGLSEPS